MTSFPGVSFDQSAIKTRFGEEYASRSINEKDLDSPYGILTGFVPSVSPGSPILTLVKDATKGRSHIKVESNSEQATIDIIVKEDVQLDFTSHSTFPVYVAARATYTSTANTSGELYTTASVPNGITEIALCKISGTALNMSVSTVGLERTSVLATSGKDHGYMRGGSQEELDLLTSKDESYVIKATTLLPGDSNVAADGEVYRGDFSTGTGSPDSNIYLPISSSLSDGAVFRLLLIADTNAAHTVNITASGADSVLTTSGYTTVKVADTFKGHFLELVLNGTNWHVATESYRPGGNAHATSHYAAGSDPIPIDKLAAPTDNSDLNVSTTAHGLCPKLSNVSTEFLNGVGGFSVPQSNTLGTTVIQSGASASDINTALTNYNIVYVQAGTYSVDESTVISIPNGKQLIGQQMGGSAPLFNGTGSDRTVPIVRMMGGGLFKNFKVTNNVKFDTDNTYAIVECNVNGATGAARQTTDRCRVKNISLRNEADTTSGGRAACGIIVAGIIEDCSYIGTNPSGNVNTIRGIVAVENGLDDDGNRSSANNIYSESADYGFVLSGSYIDANKLSTITNSTRAVLLEPRSPAVAAIEQRVYNSSDYNSASGSTICYEVLAGVTRSSVKNCHVDSAGKTAFSFATTSSGSYSGLTKGSTTSSLKSFADVTASNAWKPSEGDTVVVTYTGDGSSDRNIECGFAPHFIMVNKEDGSNALIINNELSDSTHVVSTSSNSSGLIKGVYANGFIIDSDASVNDSGALYRAVCIKSAIL